MHLLRLYGVLAFAICASASDDVILADGASDGTSYAAQPLPASDGTPYSAKPVPTHGGIYTSQQYAMGQERTGAGADTMWIMMGTVSIGYALLLVLLAPSCFWGPRVQSQPFVRMPDEAQLQPEYKHAPVCELDTMWRKAFVTKVYSLLVLQILVTLVICFCMIQFGGFDFYVWSRTDGAWTRSASFLTTIVLLFSMICFKNKFPHNLALLFLFTASMSYSIGVVCAGYAAMGLTVLVLEAFAITSLIFIGLTIFTMKSGIDFSFLGLILPMCLLTLVVWGFFSMIAFPSFAFSQIYAGAGALIFSLYVLYDTHAITTYLSYDDYVIGAINLYLDFVNLFLMILQLLTSGRRD